MTVSFIASIPSPSENQISLGGPLNLRAYGLLVALGVLAGIWLASRRLAKDGLDPEIIPNMALWVLPAAIVGARAYFVLTNWSRFADDLASAFRVWEGGLGIPGGVLTGTIVGVWWLRRQDVPLPPVFTAVALGLPLGQIIGRFGNWFNQELYGRPTDLPWGLEIDPEHRLPGFENDELFHPTFAYEIIWNIGLLAVLFRVDRSGKLRSGALFAVYLIGYGIGRILIETVRIDPVNSFLGVRLHIWAMVVFIAAAALYLWRFGLRGDGDLDGDSDEAPAKPQAPLARPKRRSAGATSSTRSTPSKQRGPAGKARAGAGTLAVDDAKTDAADADPRPAMTAKERVAEARAAAKKARARAVETKARVQRSIDSGDDTIAGDGSGSSGSETKAASGDD